MRRGSTAGEQELRVSLYDADEHYKLRTDCLLCSTLSTHAKNVHLECNSQLVPSSAPSVLPETFEPFASIDRAPAFLRIANCVFTMCNPMLCILPLPLHCVSCLCACVCVRARARLFRSDMRVITKNGGWSVVKQRCVLGALE